MGSADPLQECSRCNDQTLLHSQWPAGRIESPSFSGHVERGHCGRSSSNQVLASVYVAFCGANYSVLILVLYPNLPTYCVTGRERECNMMIQC